MVMKNNYSSKVAPFLFAGIFLCSCSSTNLLTISVTEPAPVSLEPDIKTVGIIDRSLPSEANKSLDKLDKIFSIEGENLDRDGAQEAVLGLQEELKQNSRLSGVKIVDRIDENYTGLDVFPSTLSWETVEQICRENNVDALFALSFYDTDANVDYQAVPTEIRTPVGINVPAIEHQATVNTLIKTGWRIYDPANKFIPDEYLLNDNMIATGRGINPAKAVQAIAGRKQAVLQSSKNIGHLYASRIQAYRIRVSRDYYVRGTNNFEIGKRRAQTGDWDGAAALWEKEIAHPKSKIAGRACYNMAIINEINGDLETAVVWAAKAYTDHKNKMALRYLKVLENRIAANKELERQRE